MIITSNANHQIKHLSMLIKKPSLRRKEGLYIVEGLRSFREIPQDNLVEVYIAESYTPKPDCKCRIYTVSDRVLETVSDTKTSQGIIAVVRMKPEKQPVYKKNGLYIVCEHIQDPGNLGTIIRMSEAAGIDGVILSADTVDIYNPKVVRATMGAIQRVSFYITEDITHQLELMKSAGISVLGAALGESMDYAELDYKKGTAFVIGNEANGLTEKTMSVCSSLIHIPMLGSVESLNAAIAASVLAFEAARQRRRQ